MSFISDAEFNDLAKQAEQISSDILYGNRKKDEQKITGKQKKVPPIKLTIEERQNQIVMLRARGKNNKQISDTLQVSLSTVEKDLHKIKNSVVKTYKNFQQAGVFEAFQDACTQVDLIQSELWKIIEYGFLDDRLKALRMLQSNISKKLDIYKLSLVNSTFFDKLNKK